MKRETQAAEFPEGTEFNLGANYDVPDLSVEDPDPNMRYYLAAKIGGADRPDSVEACKRIGYRVSQKKCASPDCVLMEIPREVYLARERARYKRDAQKLQSALTPPDEFKTLREDHGVRRGVDDGTKQ